MFRFVLFFFAPGTESGTVFVPQDLHVRARAGSPHVIIFLPGPGPGKEKEESYGTPRNCVLASTKHSDADISGHRLEPHLAGSPLQLLNFSLSFPCFFLWRGPVDIMALFSPFPVAIPGQTPCGNPPRNCTWPPISLPTEVCGKPRQTDGSIAVIRG